MIGFTYFSVAITSQSLTMYTPSLIAGGAYAFTELARYYNVASKNKPLRLKKKKLKELRFLI